MPDLRECCRSPPQPLELYSQSFPAAFGRFEDNTVERIAKTCLICIFSLLLLIIAWIRRRRRHHSFPQGSLLDHHGRISNGSMRSMPNMTTTTFSAAIMVEYLRCMPKFLSVSFAIRTMLQTKVGWPLGH